MALALPGGAGFVTALRRVWDDGDAIAPVDRRLPPAAREAVLDALAPAVVIDERGERHRRHGGRPVEDGDAVVIATSGTTGAPKGVVLTHAAVVSSARSTSTRLGVDPARDHWLACLPLGHIGGLSVVMRAVATETPLTVHDGFDAAAAVVAAHDGATLTSLVATAMARLDPTLFRAILLGGGAPPAVVPANAVVTYGLTESGSGVVYDGAPLDGMEVRLAGDGEILLRGPMLLRAYRDGSDPRRADGWLPTGDVGTWDGDGRLMVHGRRGDMIVTGGENVWPDPVERVLSRHPAVAAVAVTGRPDDEWGERVVAYVVPAGTLAPTLDELRELVKAELPAWAAPREVVLVEVLPRTPVGKVRRRALP